MGSSNFNMIHRSLAGGARSPPRRSGPGIASPRRPASRQRSSTKAQGPGSHGNAAHGLGSVRVVPTALESPLSEIRSDPVGTRRIPAVIPKKSPRPSTLARRIPVVLADSSKMSPSLANRALAITTLLPNTAESTGHLPSNRANAESVPASRRASVDHRDQVEGHSEDPLGSTLTTRKMAFWCSSGRCPTARAKGARSPGRGDRDAEGFSVLR